MTANRNMNQIGNKLKTNLRFHANGRIIDLFDDVRYNGSVYMVRISRFAFDISELYKT